MSVWFEPAHMPCTLCGASLARDAREGHVCDPERSLDYRMIGLATGVAAFERELEWWLGTPRGRFAAFLAARTRPA